MMKKFTSLAAALLLVLGLAACGSADSVSAAASVSQSASASSAVPESESTAESESSSESTSESVAESTSTSASETTSATAVAANGVTGIELSSTGGLLYVGYSASAKVYTTPYEAPAANAAEVKYTSSDESVVTVTPNTSGEAGFMVQGVAPGTATVTVEYQGHTAEYNLTVQKYVAPVKTNTSSGTNAAQGSTTPSAQAPAATAPATQAPAATAPAPVAETPAPTTETPKAPGLYDANGQPAAEPAPGESAILYDENGNRVIFNIKPQEGVGYDPNDRIGGDGFDWGAVNGGDAVPMPD